MRKIIMLFAMAMALLSAGAMAQGTKDLMFGGKGGFMKPHGSNNDAGFNVGAVLGKPIQGNLSWEAELMLGVIEGDVGTNHDWSINSVAGYAVYRSQGDVHLKAKLGVSLWNDDFDDDANLTAGIGLGFRMGRGILDVEYTQINPNADYITVGYILPF
ncbi:MAG: outer membrane beta-barrel protein [Betaproteobacteria bacterium]